MDKKGIFDMNTLLTIGAIILVMLIVGILIYAWSQGYMSSSALADKF